MTDKEPTAVTQVVDAFNVPGINPGYHQRQREHLQYYWPSLYHALQRLTRENQ